MPRIIFITPDGTRHDVAATPGASVMEAARAAGLPGMLAECGGACACATCHGYVQGDWPAQLPALREDERDMLDFTDAPADPARSRLTCQITVTEALDGLEILLPEPGA